jgi:PAS domain S-box-containing protein
MRGSKSTFVCYGMAVVTIAVAVLARMALDPYLHGRLLYATFFAAVATTAWLCGWKPALLSTVLGNLAAKLIFVSPRFTLRFDRSEDVLAAGIYFIIDIVVIIFIHNLQKDRDKAILQKFQLEREMADRKKAEEALRDKEELVNRAQEIANLGSWTVDLARNRISWSDQVYRIFGVHPDEFGGTPGEFLESVHPKDRESVRSAYVKSLKDGSPTYEIEHRVVRKTTGEVRIVHEKCAHFRDESGRVIRSVGMVHDITRRKKMEEELRRSEEKARNLLRYAPVGIFEVDFNGPKFIRVNEVMCEVLGYPESELLALNPLELLSESDQAPTQERIRRRMAGEKIDDSIEHKIRAKGGREYDVVLTTTLTFCDGAPQGAFIIAHDVTDRKRMEEELRRSRDELEMRVQERTAKLQESENRLRALASELINAQETERKRIAHELHDSLAAQLASIKYRVEHRFKHGDASENPATLKDTIQDIQDAITETRRIMANLRPSVLDDIGIIAALSWLSRETEKAYPGTFVEYSGNVQEREISEDLKIVIFRVVQEAVTNAIRHGKSPKVCIGLERNDGWLRLIVQDKGRGFDSVKVGVPSGSHGIGLNSMQQRVDSTGGIFSISSSPGRGTTVKAEWRLL